MSLLEMCKTTGDVNFRVEKKNASKMLTNFFFSLDVCVENVPPQIGEEDAQIWTCSQVFVKLRGLSHEPQRGP